MRRLLSVLWLFLCGLAWGNLPHDSFARLNYAALYQDLTWGTTAGVCLLDGTNWFQLNMVSLSGFYRYPTVTQMLPVTVSFTYDDNRNLLADGTRNFTYDDANRLIEVYVTNSWNNWRSTYAYDGLSRRRIRKDYTWQSNSWSLNNETHYIYVGSTVIQERNALNQPTVTYTRGNGLLARTDTNGTCYYHVDGNHNVTALVNSQGTLVARYIYDPYGNLLEQWGSMADANLYRFASQEVHPLSGLYAYPFRFYDPNLGRWINRDPIGFLGGRNPFAFVGNDPINYVDPLGLAYSYASDPQNLASVLQQGVPGPLPYIKSEGWAKDRLIDVPVGLVNNAVSTVGNTLYQTGQLIDWALRSIFPNQNDADAASVLLATTPVGWPEDVALLGRLSKCKAAKPLPAKLYHYTGEGNIANILEKGSGYDRPLTWTTPAGNLSPVQAQIELALPANRGYPGALFEIDTARLQQLGINPAVGPQRIMSTPNAGGGGIEFIFNQPIPPSAIRQVPFP